ncbi:MAG: hypothetical protein AAF430_01415 [Myxococcota bacterium]
MIHNLSIVSGYSEESIKETHSLKNHLDMGVRQRESLAPGFEVIAREYNSDAVISKAECGRLATVKASIDLVWSRAKGSS